MIGIRTRQQLDMARALDHVTSVKNEQFAETYGTLCHRIPILIQTNGLCQTLAFIEDKASGSRDRAHKRLLDHIAEVLGTDSHKLLAEVRSATMMDYIHQSRRIMDAWIYYKRFSVSILNVDATDDQEDAS